MLSESDFDLFRQMMKSHSTGMPSLPSPDSHALPNIALQSASNGSIQDCNEMR